VVVTAAPGAAEAVIATTPPLNISLDFSQIIVIWYFVLFTGATTTSLIVLLRRGTTITGTLVNVSLGDGVAAGVNLRRSGVYVDTPGAVAGQQYSLTLTQTGATGNGALNDVCLIAFSL